MRDFLTFRYAGVYTTEEVALMTKEKMLRLQALYVQQFKRLQLLLKEARRTYLQDSQQELTSLGRPITGM